MTRLLSFAPTLRGLPALLRFLVLAAGWAAATAVVAKAAPAPVPAISAERLSADVRTLASDSFGGRAPGTPGETVTVDWLVAQLKAIGLKPGGPNGAWIQPVPLVRTQLGTAPVTLQGAGQAIALTQGTDVYLTTVRPVDRISLAGAPLVFVGYGIDAPERGWDDFKGHDLKGKVAVFLINDPDFEAPAGEPVAGTFGGRRMTYYGRWTYKFEEAARRGAVAALIVHDTPGAGYGWSTVIAGGGENYDIAEAPYRVALQGWIEGAAAQRLFAAAGLDLAAQRIAARSPGFRPVELGLTLAADLPVTHSALMSRNVLAKLAGTRRPREVVIYGAHWDAYGQGSPDAQGRTVRPGANDDALGVAGLLELARAFRRAPAPQRSLVFAFWTGEERGLLGSQTYAARPLYRPADTVANITLDILQTGGPARDVLLVGQGQNSLEDDLVRAAAEQGRTVTPEALPERGLFYRADHFPLAKRGIPTLLLMAISGAPDLVRGGREAGQAWLDGYMRCYHQTCDAWSPDLDFTGAAQDVALAWRVGRDLANSARWPQWRAGSEFRQVRAADGR
ncbi:M20/M25/M40 family metallo-hydrolase [Novosphingobium piscinae]|uniref:M20/M25/M40 family metallo-hydrolase n=1 Tax=Novosphingobium piscinae TaxID=1507448 RepID=A0A7X1KNL7_9SPHN|nr:M20/M25/M40 family metallo-hydrolase [Novosphingobium piscinae]MBC2667767.1 M20/M25/M40 family metallo-hydrolase [Novosphingobium piscinae]